jgi:beta-glucosidase
MAANQGRFGLEAARTFAGSGTVCVTQYILFAEANMPFHKLLFPTFPCLIAALLGAAIFVNAGFAQLPISSSSPPSDAEVRRFVDRLIKQMTLAEKVGQMEQSAGQPMYTPPAQAEELARTGGTGSFLFFTDPVRINELQHIAVEQSRLHIPLIFGYDVIHGFNTIAPIPLAMASSWDMDLITRTQAVAAKEARAAGVHWAFGPMVDIARDARWGRIMESAGEDTYLGRAIAAAQVRGFQGEFVGSPDHIIVSVKHFGGYGAAEGGRDYEASDISDEQLQNVYLPPYKAGVDAGAVTLMSAYMDLNGIPASANKWLLQDTLRKEWGFKGFVVSDWETVKSLETHGFAANPVDAAKRAFDAGVNMEMTSSLYRQYLPDAVKRGEIKEADIDAMIRPILETKYRMGLFTNPYVDMAKYKEVTGSADARSAVREAAEKTAVLLRNEGGVLPLSKGLKSVAVIGPLADSKLDTLGSWAIHGDREHVITVAQGIREMLPGVSVEVTKGVEISRGSPTIFDEQVPPPALTLTTDALREAEFQHALELARAAEVSVLVLGEAQTMNGERASRASLSLPGEQERLLEAVAALGKPVVLVLLTGRPLDITWASTHVQGILNAWYPGSEGGRAVAKLLFGETNPSGHLTVTWPRAAGQEPMFYNENLTQIPDDPDGRYWDLSSAPLYPFGHGLSYSKFELSDLKLGSATVKAGGKLTVSAKLTNGSGVPGMEVVQLYTHQRAGSASRPIRELKGFQKVMVDANGTKTVELTLDTTELSFWSSATHKRVLEPGTFDLWLGVDSTANLHETFTVMP